YLFQPYAEHFHWTGDIFQLLFARVLKAAVELALNVLIHAAGHTDTARLGKTFKTCCHVDTVSKYVALIGNNIAHINSDTKFNSTSVRLVCIAIRHGALNLDSATDCVDSASELD